jgi:hypothetical protein
MLFKASRLSRHIFLMSAAATLLVGGLGRTAAATECTTDSDCASGYLCVPGTAVAGIGNAGGATSIGSGAPSAGDGAGGAGGSVASPGAGAATGSLCSVGGNCASTASPPPRAPSGPATDAGAVPVVISVPNPLPPVPAPTPIVAGTCQLVCTRVADCPSADFDCVMHLIPTVAVPCPADAKCPTPAPQTSNIATCVAKLRACSTAADCPAPLICQAQAGTCSGGGSVEPDTSVSTTTETCTPGPSVCTWVPLTCVTDGDCASSLYQCVKVGESGWCSGSAQACAAGATCPPPPPSTCGTTAIMNCMPKLIDCGAGQACPTGWTCFDFLYLGGVPTTWGSIASNQSCLPDGMILAAQGYAAGGIPFGAPSGTSGGGASGTVTIGSSGTGGTGGTGGGVPVIGTGVPGSAPPYPLIPVPATKDGATGGAGGSSSATGPSGTAPSLVSPVPPSQGGATGSVAGEASATAHSGGCAYGGSAGENGLWLALAVTGLVVRLARRRNRVR